MAALSDIEKDVKKLDEEILHVKKHIVISNAKKKEASTNKHKEPHIKDLEMWARIKQRLENQKAVLSNQQTSIF